MPAERTTMRQVREIVRLHEAGVTTRQIRIRVGVAASTVRLTLQRVAAAGLSGGIALEQTDAALEAVLFSGAGKKLGHRRHPDPDWAAVHRELKRKRVTLLARLQPDRERLLQAQGLLAKGRRSHHQRPVGDPQRPADLHAARLRQLLTAAGYEPD